MLYFTSKQEKQQSYDLNDNIRKIVIRNGIDTPKLSYKRRISKIRKRYNKLDTDTLQILYLGRIDPKKGIEILIKSLSSLKGSIFSKLLELVKLNMWNIF